MEQKKYMDIMRIKEKNVGNFEKGDKIVIQEKIDGANFSFRYNKETDTIRSFSRKTELDFKNNLRGAWNWVETLDKEWVKTVLGDRYIVFCEWLVPHTVVYPKDKYQKAYCFDVWDTVEERYLPQERVKTIARALEIIYVPVFYEGEFTSWEDVQAFVGRTDLGGEYGEGIVVKNMTKLNNTSNRQPFYIKIVGEHFAEKKDVKPKMIDPEAVAARERQMNLTSSIVTEARVRKLVNKMIDEGIIPEDWDEQNMRTIAQNLGKAVYEDCIKEEPETVAEIGEQFGKFAASIAMKIVKTHLL